MKKRKLSLCLMVSACLLIGCGNKTDDKIIDGNARADFNHFVSSTIRNEFANLQNCEDPIKYKSSFTEEYQKSKFYDYRNNLPNKSFKLVVYSFEEIRKDKNGFEPYFLLDGNKYGFSNYNIEARKPYYGRIENTTTYTFNAESKTLSVVEETIDLGLTNNTFQYSIVSEDNHPYKVVDDTKEQISELSFDEYIKTFGDDITSHIEYLIDVKSTAEYYKKTNLYCRKQSKIQKKLFRKQKVYEENTIGLMFDKELYLVYASQNFTKNKLKPQTGSCVYDCLRIVTLEYLD